VLIEKDEFIKGNAEKALKFDAFLLNHQTQFPNLSFLQSKTHCQFVPSSGKTNSSAKWVFFRFIW